jgi:hypothetical protein
MCVCVRERVQRKRERANSCASVGEQGGPTTRTRVARVVLRVYVYVRVSRKKYLVYVGESRESQ